ncbi:hypothetical protein OS493_013699 [Desmophyllum pertusum]|uniref:Sialomucin core protein 24 n=1 Tax=Desmophyllum pertusum TaxID=174260 RepID=A0A9W9ZRL8_9CNID|nr:hypothetical protein OS493_013699 [Desmophyllum pertusum]
MARMTIFSGLQSEMSVLGLLVIVYLMSLTVVSDASGANTVTPSPISNSSTSVSPSITTTAIVISPTKSEPVTPATSTATTGAPTQVPVVQPTTASTGRQFDSASFFGGIILGIVITVILIFAFKWWQSRNKSYHSL